MATTAGTFSRWGHWIKEHPYATAGVVFIGGAILIYLYYADSGQQTAQSGGATTDYLTAQLQSEAIQAQLSAQLSSQQMQEQSVATQVGGQVQIAQLAAGVQNQQTAAGQAVDLANISAGKDVSLANIGAQQAVDLAQIKGQVDMSGQLYGYLNNQATLQYATNANWIQAFSSAFLSNEQYNALEGQLGTTNQAVAATNQAVAGLGTTIGGLSSSVGTLQSAQGTQANALNQLSGFLNQGTQNIYHFNPNLPTV